MEDGNELNSPFALPSLESLPEEGSENHEGFESLDSFGVSRSESVISGDSLKDSFSFAGEAVRGSIDDLGEGLDVVGSESFVSSTEGNGLKGEPVLVESESLPFLIRQALENERRSVLGRTSQEEGASGGDAFSFAGESVVNGGEELRGSPYGVSMSDLSLHGIKDREGSEAIADAVKVSVDDWANRLLNLTGMVEGFELTDSSNAPYGNLEEKENIARGEDEHALELESQAPNAAQGEIDEWDATPIALAILGKSSRNPWFDSEGTREGSEVDGLRVPSHQKFYSAGQLPYHQGVTREGQESSPFATGLATEGNGAGGRRDNVIPRSPFEPLFVDEATAGTVSGSGGTSSPASTPKRGRPAGAKNRTLSPQSEAKVAKAKNTKILGSGLSPELQSKAKRIAKKNAENSDHTIDGIRLTPRDYLILIFLARYRVATVSQLARIFETSQTALRNRLPRLERAGLLDWAWGAATKPKLWLITEAGLDTVGMDLNAPTVKWGQLRHTLGLVDLGITFEQAEEVVLTEREIRAAFTRHLPTARMKSAIGSIVLDEDISYSEQASMVQGAVKESLILPIPGRAFGHIPDMVLVRQPYPNGDSGNVSIELELTRKSISEWKTILTQYRDSRIFAEVYYFVLSGELKRSLNSVIKKIHAEDKIKVFDFKPIDLAADPYVSGGGSNLFKE